MISSDRTKPSASRAAAVLQKTIGEATRVEIAEVADMLNRIPGHDQSRTVAELLTGTVYDSAGLPAKEEKAQNGE